MWICVLYAITISSPVNQEIQEAILVRSLGIDIKRFLQPADDEKSYAHSISCH